MSNNKENKQKSLLLEPRRAMYIGPWSSNIPTETTALLAASGPNAGIEDIKYGGNLFDENIDDN